MTPRRGYSHHGIYAGDGAVLHYSGLSRTIRGGPVESVTLAAFAHGRPVHVACRSAEALPMREVVERARSRLGEAEYHLIRNNCEHYAAWARYGVSRSEQVEQWLGPALAITRPLIRLLRRGASPFGINAGAQHAAA